MTLRWVLRGAAALLTLVSVSIVRADLDPNVAPGGNLDLAHWTLSVPADADGGFTGRPVTIPASKLHGPAGYQSKWFATAGDGSVEFWTPVNGALFANQSLHPRSELREQLEPGSDALNWGSDGVSVLDARLSVVSVPSTTDPQVIVGQIHAHGGGPLIMVYYSYDAQAEVGSLLGVVKPGPILGTTGTRYTLGTGIELGSKFKYRISLIAGVLFVTFNDDLVVAHPIDEAWKGVEYYFKAGCYLTGAGTDPQDGARVRFYRLAASHPNEQLRIPMLSELPAATAFEKYSLALAADGGADSRYVWSLVSGGLPAGMALDADGVLRGVPFANDVSDTPHDFTVLVRDGQGNSASKRFSVIVE